MMLMDSTAARARPATDRALTELLRRARALPERDRALVELMLNRHLTCAEAGRLTGMHAGNVSRSVSRILRRLNDPVSAALFDRGTRLPPDVYQLGIEHFVRGMRIGELAEMHQMTRYRVRQVLNFLRGWAKGMRG